MIKSLYARVIVAFVLVVMFSLAVSFAITYRVNEDRLFHELEDDLIQSGKSIIAQYESGAAGRLDGSLFHLYSTRAQAAIFGSDGSAIVSGNAKPDSFATPAEVQRVLAGGVHRFDYSKRGLLERRSVGLPFEAGGRRYALFLKPMYKGALLRLKDALVMALLLALSIGSLLFVLAVHWLVKPVKKLTAATTRVAAGHFDERVPDKRRDEIGELARGFNRMSGELSQLERMRKEFVSNVSHEIQSPLTSIKGFAAAVRDHALPEEQKRRYLTIIEEESDRLAQLSDKLLRLSLLETLPQPPSLRDCALDEQIRRAFLVLQPQWLGKSLTVDLSGLKPASIAGDEEQLEQVWHNLLSNSIKYTPPGGEISVSVRAGTDAYSHSHSHAVEVVFRDNGIGIAEEDLPRIFDRFYMGDKARDRAAKSSGLGLSIVRKIVELHGGTIEASSRPGEGTEFVLRFPKDTFRTQ